MSLQSKTLIIINFKAARARAAWEEIEPKLKANDIRFDTHITTQAGDATDAARKALREGYETITVVGGDGTLSETAEGFFDCGLRIADCGFEEALPKAINPNAVLAVLPAGTGDDFARGLSGKREPLEYWIEKFIAYYKYQSEIRNPKSAIDVIHGIADSGAKQFISINMASIGFSAEVVRRVASQKGIKQMLSGETRFVMSALGALVKWRERRVRIFVDESETEELSTNLLTVSNNRFAGGGMLFAPDAKVDDGMFDVLLTHDLTRLSIMRELSRIREGSHLKNPNIEIRKAKKFTIETIDSNDPLLIEADGNLRGQTPAEFRLIPKALKVLF